MPWASALSASLPFLALLALEAAPLQAWLIVYPSAEQGSSTQAAAPFLLVAASLALFALARRVMARLGAAAIMGAWILAACLSLIALLRFSPWMFGATREPIYSLDWFSALATGNFDPSPIAPLFALTLYMGWRGSVLGGPAPNVSRVSRRFSIGLGALILAIFGSLATQLTLKEQIDGALLALLALEGFAGMAALAMARTRADAGQTGTRMPGADYAGRWQVAAVGIAFVVMLVVTVIGALLNLRAAQALFVWVGPVGDAINTVLYWLTMLIAYMMYLIVALLSNVFPKNAPNQPIRLPKPPSLKGAPHAGRLIPPGFQTAAPIILFALVVILVIGILIVASRMMARRLDKPVEDDIEEEREGLDAASLLRQQAADLLNGLRRRRPVRERDDLRRDGMRAFYRQIMRVGAELGYERQANETADEYAVRLGTAIGARDRELSVMAPRQLRELAAAYDEARYGGDDPDPVAPSAAEAQARLMTGQLESLSQAGARSRR